MNNTNYIKTLDGWRAFAVTMVILTHLKDFVLAKDSFLVPFFEWGMNGVDLFFALSGYLITTKLIDELEKSNTLNLKKFYIKRFFRLMPAAGVYLLFISLFSLSGWINIEFLEIISTLTFWRNYFTSTDSLAYYTGQFWSLNVEEHFYFFLPGFLLFYKKPKKIFFAIVVLCIGVTVWRKLGTMDSFTDIFPYAKYTYFGTIGNFDALLYGVLLAYIQKYYSNITNAIKRIHPCLIILALISIEVLAVPLKPTIKAILFPLLIFSTITFDTSYLSRILELRPLRYLGALSYSAYIWQQFFAYKMQGGPEFFQYITGSWFSFIFIFIFSALSYHFVESPIRKIGYKVSSKYK